MAQCELCGKKVVSGKTISHSHRKTNRVWKPNLQRMYAVVDGKVKKIYVCTRCLRSGKVVRPV